MPTKKKPPAKVKSNTPPTKKKKNTAKADAVTAGFVPRTAAGTVIKKYLLSRTGKGIGLVAFLTSKDATKIENFSPKHIQLYMTTRRNLLKARVISGERTAVRIGPRMLADVLNRMSPSVAAAYGQYRKINAGKCKAWSDNRSAKVKAKSRATKKKAAA